MNTKALAATLLALPLLAACTTEAERVTEVTTTEVTTTEVTEADTCGAAGYQQFVGQTSPAISVPAGTAMRHYRTGDVLTMDMRVDRLNFEYDRRGKLVSVHCG